jgi:alkyl hydroperoxide reductase subunit AhpC
VSLQRRIEEFMEKRIVEALEIAGCILDVSVSKHYVHEAWVAWCTGDNDIDEMNVMKH